VTRPTRTNDALKMREERAKSVEIAPSFREEQRFVAQNALALVMLRIVIAFAVHPTGSNEL